MLIEELGNRSTYGKSQILHHSTNASGCILVLIRLSSQQILNRSIWINLHSAQVGIPIDKPSLLAELLVEGIGEVVCWVSGDEEDGAAHFGELYGERAGSGGLSDSSLTADEDPAEGALVENGLEGWLKDVLVCVEDSVGHGEDCGRGSECPI